MLFKLFLAFTLIPVAEIYLIIKLGAFLGAFNTVAIIIITGFAGAALARMQGLQTMLRVRHSLQQGIVPAEEMVDALLIFVAGIVLLTPGFITDIAGLLLLFPPSRFHIKRFLRRKFELWSKNGTIQYRHFP
ncbi:MAG: FxsA family protein [Pseudomonadota bacterium]|uniref:FxsA family protein n=1 Tax=Candidatus Desulfatibia profunda TaxID=2841695 RepID=A0A8J6NMX9_9BACT|nr:FxsA family protein [Candidatus Desulfatibia profunda]MBL7173477.1 FxsA family protein [Desulfobacteraceae bacterium]MBL7179661.1 FxsA family protein [Desulfobacterales bacterium]MBU0698839.1 FxsA family protein [Pseudomonadota bacterium]